MFERTSRRLSWLSLLAALWLLAPSSGTLAHADSNANENLAAPYAVEASKQTVVAVLERFAADHGLALRVSANPNRGWQTATLDGWLRGPTGRGFLEQLARAHHFSWFVAEGALYVSTARDRAVERIALAGVAPDSARSALEAVGIYDARFGWGELSGRDAVLVGGPLAYRALVRRFLANHASPGGGASEPGPMIFPLRYARAADRMPTETGGEVRTGVAGLLRQLLTREAATAAHPPFAIPAQADFPPLPGASSAIAQWTGFPAAVPSAPAPLPRARASIGTSPDIAETSIVADEATNSVIVWADRRWRSRIQQVVDALDRPATMVSMDVLVIETDVATVAALDAASRHRQAEAAVDRSAFDERIAAALVDHRVRLLNRQTLVGRMNAHATLAIGGEAEQASTAPDQTANEPRNGRSGNRGDRLDLAARLVPSNGTAAPLVAVDIDLLMAQPTGLPGQTWANTSSVKLDTAVTLESGSPPRLVASYPVASARAEQRAIFISAKAL